MRVFLALPESGLEAEIQEALVAAAEGAGHEVLPPLPTFHAGVGASERNRFLTAVDRMMEAEVVLADVSRESITAGWCAAWFLAKGRLVVLACRQDARGTLSPMLAGNPSPWQRTVLYADAEDLRKKLGDLLRSA